jgi:type III secretion protein J
MKYLLLIVLLFCAACSVPVASGLDDIEADGVVVALDKAGIDSSKEADSAGENKWRVVVAHDDVSGALRTMLDERLPRSEPAGILDAVGKGSLVPSEAAEHAQLIEGLGGELERSFERIDGVLSARVHLNLPVASTFRDIATAKATASVLLEHRGSTPPLTPEAVQRLVAGACAGLSPSDVAVVLVSHPAVARAPGSELSHVGPIAVSHASRRTLQLVVASLLLLMTCMAIGMLLMYRGLMRAREREQTALATTTVRR